MRRPPSDEPAPAATPPSSGEERFRLLVEAVQDYAIFLLDADGFVTSWNAGAEKLKGYRADEIIGRPFTAFYPLEAVAVGWPQEELRRARRNGRFEDEGWRLRKDGTRFWANVVITALRDPIGEVYGFAKITRDLSERKRHEEALRQSEERFRLLVNNVRDCAMCMLDTDGRIVSWNAGAQAITGYSAFEALGQSAAIFLTADERAAGRAEQELAQALRDGSYATEGWRVRKDGSAFWARLSLSPVYDDNGRLRGFAQITYDMSEKRRLQELEHTTQRISEFLAMLGHELRNPLAPMRNAVSILQMQPAATPASATCCGILDRQLDHLTRLVDDLLDVGRVASGKIGMRHAAMDFREVALRAVEAVRSTAEQCGQTLEVALPDEAVPMLGDATRLLQLLHNLLANASKYTPEGGHISLAVAVEPEAVVAEVSDDGRGIAPDALERVFEFFTQETNGATGADTGLGIGLALARTVAQLHGGSLRAHSEGRGRGSRFTLRLPRRQPAAAAPETEAPARPCESRRVLVVDDNQDAADTMCSLLRLQGHVTRVAYDGPGALQVARSFRPDVVLLDLNLPGADGFAVLRQLKAFPEPPFVVALTGYGQESDRQRSLQAGFDHHLTKPVDLARLEQAIAQAPHLDDSPLV